MIRNSLMNWNVINTILLSIICFLVIVLTLLDISLHISWEASITDWLSVIIYACTFGAAVWAGLTAKKALDENKRMANDNQRLVDAQTQPFLDISLEIMPQSVDWIRLKIQNLGLSSAFNIKFTIKEIYPDNEASKLIVDQFFQIGFMKQGLNYLSKEDSRYTNFVNLAEDDQSNGFTINDFFNTKFTVEIKFEDINKKKYTSEFVVETNDLNGAYSIGESFEDQLIKQMISLNNGLLKIHNEQKKFSDQYEKIQSGWTEKDLKITLANIHKKQKIDKFLGIPPGADQDAKYMPPKKKLSINQIRRQMR